MTNRARIATIALAVVAFAVLLTLAVALSRRHARSGPKRGAAITMAPGDVAPEPSIWIDVHSPEKAWRSVRSNAWFSRAMSEPLGQGMTAGWAGFLSTRGADLAGAFDGAVLDLVAGKLLSDPFRVIFFAGPAATGAPAVVVPRPSGGAAGAFDLLDGVARNGTYETPRCPGPEATTPAGRIAVSRWLVAEQPLFAGRRDGRIALAKNPVAVVQALCAAPPEVPAASGADVSISFSRDALGREARLGAALLGLGPAPRLAFAIERDRLEPRGILGELSEPDRLGAEAPPDSLLGLVPADAGVVLVASIRLPEKLGREPLARHLEGKYRGKLVARTVAIVWNPRGDASLPTEVALAWPDMDSEALHDAFSGPNRMERRRACGHEVYASTGALASAMERSCAKRSPSVLNAAPAVAEGLRKPASVALGVNFGLVLSRLLADAFAADPAAAKRPAPEIDSARRLLEELPFVGLRGVSKDGAFVPGGFRS